MIHIIYYVYHFNKGLKMTDDEWYEYCTNCHSMDYKHPSGVRVCLKQLRSMVFFVPTYNECGRETCPDLKDGTEREFIYMFNDEHQCDD